MSKEYIDKAAFIEYLGFENTIQERKENIGEIVTLEDFDRQPIADVVEVVRCRNCKHGGPIHDACSTGDYYCLLKDIYVFNWDFCRCGIKENEDE